MIDIYDEVDRWMNVYIVYHLTHLNQYGDLNSSQLLFEAKTAQTLGKINALGSAASTESIISQLQKQGIKSSKALKIVDSLQNGNLLEQIIDLIATTINNGIDQASQNSAITFDNYDTYISRAKEFSNLLVSPNTSRVIEFFNLLIWGMQETNLIDLNTLDALTGIGKQLVGTQFQISTDLTAIPVSSSDISATQEIMNSLSKAADKFSEQGTLSARSFARTINQIFVKTLGTKFEEFIVAQGIQEASLKADEAFQKSLIDASGGKMKWVSRDTKNKKLTPNINVNLFGNEIPLSLKIKGIGNLTWNVEIANTSQINWTRKKKVSNKLKVVDRRPIGEFFTDNYTRYLAYNTMAHGKQAKEALNQVESFVTASFFLDWLTKKNIQNMQFIAVKGKIYPIHKIVDRICRDMVNRHQITSLDMIDINRWRGAEAKPNIDLGILRSQAVNEAINKMMVSFQFNENALVQYAY